MCSCIDFMLMRWLTSWSFPVMALLYFPFDKPSWRGYQSHLASWACAVRHTWVRRGQHAEYLSRHATSRST